MRKLKLILSKSNAILLIKIDVISFFDEMISYGDRRICEEVAIEANRLSDRLFS
ncbi:hypothetical protein IQ278_11465 [Tolypothrix sp. LEGE 11397]|uniref:hypothetical protein n=1 Tax=unclassified Tolypothrix TaxID=2649714 RepID=UPI0005EAB93C|nr:MULTISPECIES: hypothetical protein [unclassified Tolypothrix]BAY91955.1 hypothetical protein NIES3275_39860 [Microchaete diplosiphon NIES-3275]EKF04867.1 hypothetical protein FDUTEX481_01027 [Tolypothrix sp. PCC 7601]MBE9082735.1 hypothetical protein [Tolypothrix sp. LEGE 11397]UYD25951.1 hypothetical protein HGR01_32315 [Tolypothrix sp. PCC 7712]UYD31810.1 hypothetical protein HG267_22210 [Tolypothrix sp. PCC 7601]